MTTRRASSTRGDALSVVPDGHDARCANCEALLRGDFCGRCGQKAVSLHRPLADLLSDVVGDILNLDTRVLRTLRPLILTPGAVAKDYVAGRRAAHVPPLKSYLIAALVFFSLFTFFPSRTPVSVFVMGSAAEKAAKARGGSKTTIGLPAHSPIGDARFQEVSARAMQQPEAFAQTVYANIPRVFFLFLPLFAVFLELFYRKQGFFVDHLIFSLYYHAFVFLDLALLYLVIRARPHLPGAITFVMTVVLLGWLVAYLPLALRRVYGGGRLVTGFKVVALGALYAVAFIVVGLPLILGAALAQF